MTLVLSTRMEVLSRPHAVMIPFAAQGHIKPMLEIAKMLSARGYYITFVNTEFIHEKMMKSGLASHAMENFRFETIPDGLPPEHGRTLQIDELCTSLTKNGPAHFDKLIDKLKELSDVPPFTCIFHDGIVSWSQKTATRLGIPAICFWTTSACGFCIYISVPFLVEKGYVPLQGIIITFFQTCNYKYGCILSVLVDFKHLEIRDYQLIHKPFAPV